MTEINDPNSILSPPLSLLLPCRNGAKFLPELIPQIFCMMESGDELLVIEDGSTDNSEEILQNFAFSDARLRVLQTGGVGLIDSLNMGVIASRHSWIARFDVDDEYSHSRLTLQRMAINKDIDLIFSDYEFISESSISLGKIPSAIDSNSSILSLFSSQRTPHPSALMLRETVIKVGAYKSSEFPAEDLGLWLRIANFGNVITIPHITLRYRLSKISISATNRENQIQKRKELISRFDKWPLVFQIAIQNFHSTVLSYEKYSLTSSRIFFHIIDIIRVGKYTNSKIPFIPLIVKLSSNQLLKLFFAAISIIWFTTLRKLYRKY